MPAGGNGATVDTLAGPRTITALVLDRDAGSGCPEDPRIVELQREIDELREAVRSRELIGWVSGILANRFGLTQERVWQLLVQLSQNTNVKLREVARVISAAHAGTLEADDQTFAVRLNSELERLLPRVAAGRPAGPDHAER